MVRIFTGWFSKIILAVLGVFGVTTIIGATVSHIHWVFDFLGIFLIFGFWALTLVGLYGVYAWRWRTKFILPTILLIVFFGVMGARHETDLSAQEQDVFKVYQHNVWNRNRDRALLAEGILATSADLVVLLEAAPAKLNGFLRPLNPEYAYAYTDNLAGRRFTGLQIYSKFEITEKLRKRTQSGAAIFVGEFQHVGEATHLAVVHFARPWPFEAPDRQNIQAKEVIAELSKFNGPMILMGDFNSPPWGRVIKRLQTSLGLVVGSTGLKTTWPNEIGALPITPYMGIPIDLVLTRGPFSVYNWHPAPALGSDHRAVVYEVG